jgi:hypothetical protein
MFHGRPPSWLAGVAAATAILIAVGVASLGFLASFGGLVIAGALALMVGVAAGAAADCPRAGRTQPSSRFTCWCSLRRTLILLPALAGPQPPNARGSPGVYSSPQRAGPAVNPPPREP